MNSPLSVLQLDFLSQAFQADEWAAYAKMREHGVTVVNPGGLYAIARFEDVRSALKDTETFSSEGYKDIFQPDWLAKDCHRDPIILRQDPPAHDVNRRMVNKCFVTRVIKPLEDRMYQHAAELFERITPETEIDFLEQFAYPFVLDTIGRIAGTTDQPGSVTRRWIERAEAITHVRPSNEDVVGTEQAIRQQNAYFDSVIASRKQTPRNDVATVLTTTQHEGAKFTSDEMRGLLDLFVGAGLNTSVHLLCHIIIFLGNNPEFLPNLQREPHLIPAFVEESLRFSSPTRCVPRTTTRTVEIGGMKIPSGSTVLLMLAAANRDPDKFPNPDIFQLDRPNAKEHLAFGDGNHVCLGGALARMEARIAVESLAKKFRNCQCPPAHELEYVIAIATHGVKKLPVQLS